MGAAAMPYGKKLGQMLADDETSVVVAAVAAWQQLGKNASSGIEEVVKILAHQQDVNKNRDVSKQNEPVENMLKNRLEFDKTSLLTDIQKNVFLPKIQFQLQIQL